MPNETLTLKSLEMLFEAKHDALPTGFNKIRYLQNSKAYLAEIEDINNYKAEDIAQQLFKGAVLGLDFLNKECHVIFDKGKVGFQTDYKGEMKLAKKHSVRPLLDIFAKIVRAGDEFRELVDEGKPKVHFNPLPFNNSEIVGSFAVALFADGGMIYETMSAEEIELVRKHYGKKRDNDTWDKSKGELSKRTVLRRLCKMIDIDFDAEQRLAFEDGSEFEFNKEPRPVQVNPLNESESEVITNEANEG
ncbi:MAG TPA: recombinase RecT [Candidatus Paenibacillus intestinavium]|nr:recombinase RecT [Candidatus Paenibacillus intestinavium]